MKTSTGSSKYPILNPATKMLTKPATSPLPRRMGRVPLLAIIMLTLIGQGAFAVNDPILSDFNGELEPEFLEGSGDPYGMMFGGQILGGIVDVEVAGSTTAESTGSALSVDASGGGTAVLSWDGEDEEATLDPTGLGNVDLTLEEFGFTVQDALMLSFESVTSPGNFTIEVFSDDGEASSFSGTLSVGSSIEKLIPYGAFSVSQGGGALFNQVSAIQITLGGGLAATFGQLETAAALSGITKVDSLLIDVNTNSTVEPGETLRYTITIPASASASGVILTDTLDTNTTLVVGSVTTTIGSVTEGNTGGDTGVEVNLGTLPGTNVVVTFDALINNPYSGSAPICNQATVSATGLSPVLSDDPDDGTGSADTTCTTVLLDLTPPVLNLPADTTVDQGTDSSPSTTGEATATDDQTASPNVTFSDSETDGPVPFQSVITRTWTATDEAGNTTEADQLITLADVVSRSLLISQQTYGLFSPLAASGRRQLGTIDTAGNVGLLGSDTSLDTGDIATGAGFTTFDRATKTIYALGKTASDDQSRIFAVNATDGSSTNSVLGFGTISTVVGIWWDEVGSTLFGVFQVGAGLADRQLGSINPTNGVVTLVGSPNTTISGTIGGILAGNRANGKVYFLGTPGGLPGAIYTVDLATGSMTNAPLSGANYNAIAGMNFNQSDGKLYALTFQTTERRLAELDPSTGTVTPLGTTTVAGGGVPITTYTGVNTLDEDSGTFLFIGRYNSGSNNTWAIFGVDTTTGDTTFSEIDHSTITAHGYYGLDYGELKELDIVASGFVGADFYVDVEQGTSFLKVTSSDDLFLPFTDVGGVTEMNDGNGDPNRFLIPSSSLATNHDFFRVETE